MPTKNKELQASFGRKHYLKNKAAIKKRAKDHKREQAQSNWTYIKDLKSKTPCKDCGNTYPPCVMDFDHIKGKKSNNVGTGAQGWSLKRLQEEIDKCEIVCSNCHRIRTHITRK